MRTCIVGVGLGASGFALQSGLFFASLTRLDAALADLVLFAYPSLVTVAAVLIGRERWSRRRVSALVISLAGVSLVLVGGGLAAIDTVGALLALASAVTYTVYVLVSDGALRGGGPLVFAALVVTGAAVSFIVTAAARGQIETPESGQIWLLLTVVALGCTVLPITALLAGMRRVGASTSSIVSSLEPPVTVGISFLAMGHLIGPGAARRRPARAGRRCRAAGARASVQAGIVGHPRAGGSCPPLRSSTLDQSIAGSRAKTSSTRAGSRNQASLCSSPSSCPAPQPA